MDLNSYVCRYLYLVSLNIYELSILYLMYLYFCVNKLQDTNQNTLCAC